jgi:hypothetical protein
MKYFLLPFLLICSLFFSSFSTLTDFISSTDTIEIDDVVVALNSGNASRLSRYFENRVDISLPERTENYSRTQAEMVMRDFFSDSGVRNFKLKYKSDKTGSNYCVGTLQTKSGNYRTTLLLRQKGERQYVQDLSFQKIE